MFLEIRDVRKRFGKVEAVRGVSLDVHQGEFFTLLGPSGCGKSTLLRLIAGLDMPDAGEINLDGRCLAAPEQGTFVPAERRNMGMVFQSHAIWPHMTVFQNVAYPLEIRGLRRAEIQERVHGMLKLVGLSEHYDRPASRLSGGQQQRVSLARALVYSPSVLLLDEPLSSLDARLRDDLRRQVKRLQRQLGLTVIFVTHDQTEAFSMSDRVAVLQSGQVEQLGVPQQVYAQPKTSYVRDFLGHSLVLHGTVVASNDEQVTVMARDSSGDVELCVPNRFNEDTRHWFRPGADVRLTVRPEHLRVVADGSTSCISVQVEDVLYVGNGYEYLLAFEDHSEVITLPGDLSARPGEMLRLHLDPAWITLWPGDAPPD